MMSQKTAQLVEVHPELATPLLLVSVLSLATLLAVAGWSLMLRES